MNRALFSKLNVLVADDTYMASLTSSMLRTLGTRSITEVYDLRGVTTALQREEFGLVLIDHNLAPSDPIEVIRTLRADPHSWNRHVPVLMTFTAAEKARIVAARDAGVTEFLKKPLSANVIGLRVVQALENPRPFVEAPKYVGPDRRRRAVGINGPDRRHSS